MDFDEDYIAFYFDANTAVAGNQEFDYANVAYGAFTRTAGQLRYVFEGGNTILRGDINGDGRADFSIEILGQFDLGSGDFLRF